MKLNLQQDGPQYLFTLFLFSISSKDDITTSTFPVPPPVKVVRRPFIKLTRCLSKFHIVARERCTALLKL